MAQLRARERTNGAGAVEASSLELPGVEAALLEIISSAERHGVSLDDLRGQVTLESVFIDLTGRDLRE